MSRSSKNSVKVINRKILDYVPSHPNFKVFMYNDELEYVKWLVLQKDQIETGGDLFGLWQNQNTAVVQLVIGPGKNCSRTTTSFHQDVKYLEDVGQHVTSLYGLCNIGEWHSHHRIGLAEPSLGDKDTVWNHMADVAGGRFLVFIANIIGKDSVVRIGCFMFDYSNKKMLVGDLVRLPESSPLRQTLNSIYLKPGTEPGQDWETFLEKRRTLAMDILGDFVEYDDSDPDNVVVGIKLPPQLSQPSVDLDVEGRDYGEEERLIPTANEKQRNKHFGRRLLQSVCVFSAWSKCREWKFCRYLCTFKRYMSRLIRGFFTRLISSS